MVKDFLYPVGIPLAGDATSHIVSVNVLVGNYGISNINVLETPYIFLIIPHASTKLKGG